MTSKTACIIASILTMVQIESAETQIGLIGGSSSTATSGYGAFVAPNAIVTTLSPTSTAVAPGSASIVAVAINDSGAGLLGGIGDTAYAARVAPDGGVTLFSGASFLSTGTIDAVAINDNGYGILGGQDASGSSPGYVALVSPDGALTKLSGATFPTTGAGRIYSASINASGTSLIGGQDLAAGQPAYAALVSSGGTITALSGANLPAEGRILSVALNDAGNGIIGGFAVVFPANTGYAARVLPGGTLSQLTSPNFPSSDGTIYSVAINKEGTGIIGGRNTGTGAAYLARMAPGGALQELGNGAFFTSSGSIGAVAINDAGVGLVGGPNINTVTTVYAAFVAPDGTLQPIALGTPGADALINSVAISREGIGLIGGYHFAAGNANAVLVAPNGTITALYEGDISLLIANGIDAVAIMKQAAPQSAGSYWSAINTQFAAAFALETHLSGRNRLLLQPKQPNSMTALFASAEEEAMIEPEKTHTENRNTSLWVAPFGDLVYQQAQGNNPSYSNEIAGVLVGLDHSINRWLFGGGIGYAFNYARYGSELGHGKIQEGMINL